MKGRPLTDNQKQAIRRLREKGFTIREISRRVSLGTNAVARACRDIVVRSAPAAPPPKAKRAQVGWYNGARYVEAEETQEESPGEEQAQEEEEPQEEELSEPTSTELKDMEPEEILARMTALDSVEREGLSGLRVSLLMGNNESVEWFKKFLYGHRAYKEQVREIHERYRR
jgi:DNA-binding transcriptional MerR regulator